MYMAIVERFRWLLPSEELLEYYCCEALMVAVYLTNFAPSYSLSGDVSNTVYYNKHVSYYHLEVSGYKAFVHIP
jgi:hypothetical protein